VMAPLIAVAAGRKYCQPAAPFAFDAPPNQNARRLW